MIKNRERGHPYVELQVATHFSFLRGVSSAEELFATAALLGFDEIAVTDRNSLPALSELTRQPRQQASG